MYEIREMNDVEEAKLKNAVAEFMGAFEVVFDREWTYSQEQLQYEISSVVAPGGTFLHLGNDPTRVNWGARAALLQAYEHLRTAVQECGFKPELPLRDDWFDYAWPDKSR